MLEQDQYILPVIEEADPILLGLSASVGLAIPMLGRCDGLVIG